MVAAVGRRAVAFALYQAQVRKPRELARLHSRENGIVQAFVGACAQATGCAAGFVSQKMVAVVGRRAVAFALYQAQVQKPRRLARLHSRENGIVQAFVDTCAQAAGLSSAHLEAVAGAL